MANRFRLRDVTAVLVLCALAAAALVPAAARSRESARQRCCTDNLRAIGMALRQYHDAQGSLPPAAIWQPGAVSTLMLFEVKRIDRITHENWVQLLLPYLGRADIAALFDRRQPVMAAPNMAGRTTALAEFTCPTDRFNGAHNLYGFQPLDDQPPLARFARGNYAINAGTHSIAFAPESTSQPRGEKMQFLLDHERRQFRAMGTGIAGINQCLKLSDFVNGQSTLAAVDEIRAGVHSLDLRGAWALGHVGSSITSAHGVTGDDGGPNNQGDRADDILDCGRLHKAVGGDRLKELKMPCVWYVDRSQEATARSQHPGRVHVLFMDGAVRFVGDGVDRGLWHVMHSRETPAGLLDDLESQLAAMGDPPDAAGQSEPPKVPHSGPIGDLAQQRISRAVGRPSRPSGAKDGLEGRPTSEYSDKFPGKTLTNSLGMRFVIVPAGSFTMGVPDLGNDAPAPEECPPHEVKISRTFWLAEHEVTQAQYQSVAGNNPSHHLPGVVDVESTDEFPVENVTWHEAVEFCRRLSEAPDEKAQGRRYRLPTEAEWEYACRSGRSKPYAWSAHRAAGDKTGEAAGIEPALPVVGVGSYPCNAFGLYDMRGNVWEWCGDWFDRNYYGRSPRDDPQGPAKGYLKVVRGGDWTFVGEVCRINYPIMAPWRKSPFVGFRVVCEGER